VVGDLRRLLSKSKSKNPPLSKSPKQHRSPSRPVRNSWIWRIFQVTLMNKGSVISVDDWLAS